jgi:hypothetical protein
MHDVQQAQQRDGAECCRLRRVIRRSTVHGIVTATISVCVTLLGLELAVRAYRGTATARLETGLGRSTYHPRLGWIPRPGRVSSGWTSNVDASSVRSNGRAFSTASRPILAVGDSFTFGDEVEDSETWAAYLEDILHKRVINAGVGAYGLDQAFLRAELLLEEYDPDVVFLSFISDDIDRTECSYYPYGRGWKPYFEYRDGSLILRNVPVPQEPAPRGSPRRFQTLRKALRYSFLADTVFGRIAHEWWQDRPVFEEVHHDGEDVSVDLLVRLDGLTKGRGGQFVAIALATNGRIGDNARLPNVVERAREKGVTVLDLSTEMLELPPSRLQSLFRPSGHYSPEMNRWVAEHIAAFLDERSEGGQ